MTKFAKSKILRLRNLKVQTNYEVLPMLWEEQAGNLLMVDKQFEDENRRLRFKNHFSYMLDSET